MKYRIIEIEDGFLVQKRVLFRWRNVEENSIIKCIRGWYVSVSKKRVIWHSIDEAIEHLSIIRKRPLKYRGHAIYFSIGYEKLYYYEYDKVPYHVTDSYKKIKEIIDKIEDEKESKSRILKIYDEHGNHKN